MSWNNILLRCLVIYGVMLKSGIAPFYFYTTKDYWCPIIFNDRLYCIHNYWCPIKVYGKFHYERIKVYFFDSRTWENALWRWSLKRADRGVRRSRNSIYVPPMVRPCPISGTKAYHGRNVNVPWAWENLERSKYSPETHSFRLGGLGNQKTTLNRIISAIDGYQHDMLYFYRTPIIHNQNNTRDCVSFLGHLEGRPRLHHFSDSYRGQFQLKPSKMKGRASYLYLSYLRVS